jgi:hypothetical protein
VLKEIDYAVITVFMGSVFLDINIGNAEETAQAESDYGALLGHFQSQKHQLGLGQLDNLGQLNEEARELLSDSFRRTGFAKVPLFSLNKQPCKSCNSLCLLTHINVCPSCISLPG